MKKIIIIIIFLIVIIGGGITFIVYKNKPSKITLSQNEINKNNIIVNELLDSYKNNDFNTYKNIVGSTIANENAFNDVKNTFNKDFGQYQNASFKEAFNIKGYSDLIYSASFSKKNPVILSITIDNGKIIGIHV